MPSRPLLPSRHSALFLTASLLAVWSVSAHATWVDPRPTPDSSGALATTYAYNAAGYQYEVTDNADTTTRTEYDSLGRPTAVIENYDDGVAGGSSGEVDVDRVTRYAYNAAGQIVEQTADLPSGSDDQTTVYVYSASLASGFKGSPVANNGYLRGVGYPDMGVLEQGGTAEAAMQIIVGDIEDGAAGDFVETTYYADGALRTRTDQRGVKLTYHYNDNGTRKAQVASSFDADTDDAVQSMTYTYDDLQRLLAVSSHSSAQTAPTATDVVNQVTHEYTGMGQLAKQRQDLDSIVDASGGIPTQDLVYDYDTTAPGNAFTKALRQTSITYPNGRELHTLYNASPLGSTPGGGGALIDDALSRPNGLANDDGSGGAGDTLVAYSHTGSGMTVVKDLPRIATRLSHFAQVTGDDPNDYLPGLDRFGRIDRIRWDRYEPDPAVNNAAHASLDNPLFDLRHAYDDASNRLHTERRVYEAYDEKYTHDGLDRLASFNQGVLQDDLTTMHSELVRQRQVWNLDALGNQLDTDTRDASDYVKHTPNNANELDAILAKGSTSRDQRSDTFNSSTTANWESIGTDTFDINSTTAGWMTVNTVAADTIDGNAENEARAVLLWGEAGPPVRGQYRFQFPSGATAGKAGFVFGYESANDYWLQVWDLGAQELYWQHVVDGVAGAKLATKTSTINAGSNYTSYVIPGATLAGYPFTTYDTASATSAVGRIGFFSTVNNTKFDYLNAYLADWSTPIAGRWSSLANGSVNTSDDALAFSGQSHGGAPFMLEGLRLDNFRATYRLARTNGSTTGAYVVFDDRDGASSNLRIEHTSATNRKVGASNAGAAPSTTVNQNMPACATADTLWVRVEAHAYGPSAGTVRVYANNATTQPSGGGWNLIYESTDWDLAGGRFGFIRHYWGYSRVDDLTIEADRNHDGTFEVVEHVDDFTLDGSGYAEQSPEHDDAGNLTYDGTFAYAYDAWNRLVTVTKAYKTGTSGGGGTSAVQLGSVVNVMDYDGLGRRVTKRVQNSADFDATERYYYNGQQLVEIRNGSDLVVKQHVWGLDYIDELIEVAINQDPTDTNEQVCERPFYAVHNAQYNVLGIIQPVTDTALSVTGQRLVERYEYTPYGERQVYSHGWLVEDMNGDGAVDGTDADIVEEFGSGGSAHIADVDGNGSVGSSDTVLVEYAFGDAVPQNDPLVLTPSTGTHRSAYTYGGGAGLPLNTIGHQGLSHDEETGLVYNRARHLHPQLGRFMQRDLIGYVDGMNQYQYLRSRTYRYVDWNGLQSGFAGQMFQGGSSSDLFDFSTSGVNTVANESGGYLILTQTLQWIAKTPTSSTPQSGRGKIGEAAYNSEEHECCLRIDVWQEFTWNKNIYTDYSTTSYYFRNETKQPSFAKNTLNITSLMSSAVGLVPHPLSPVFGGVSIATGVASTLLPDGKTYVNESFSNTGLNSKNRTAYEDFALGPAYGEFPNPPVEIPCPDGLAAGEIQLLWALTDEEALGLAKQAAPLGSGVPGIFSKNFNDLHNDAIKKNNLGEKIGSMGGQ